MSIDRRQFLQTSAALLASATALRQVYGQSSAGGALKGSADAILRGAVEQGDVPGVVAAVTDRNETLYQAAFGERRLGQGVPMTFDTVTYLASMTKPIAATAAMQLVEQGKLDLDTPIRRWAPEVAKIQVLDGWDGNGQPRLRPPKREITLRHLMTHTSGFVYDLWDAELARYVKATNFPGLGTGEEAAFYPPLMFDPGERWEYGISIDWIGKLVEIVSGKSLGTYMQDHIFSPLAMTSTGYRISPDMESRRATVHQRNDDGTLTATDWVRPQEPLLESGGGGLYSSADDYLRFMRMILNSGSGNGNQILKPETVELMSSNNMGDIRVTMLKTQNPARSLDAEFFPGLPKSWGLSFMINEETAPTGRPAGSLAWAGLMNTFFWIDPSTGIGGVYLTQILPFVDTKTLNTFYAFEKSVYSTMS
ncbi:MAG: beta-lactamase family protein [Candidatus Competibacteraceae bacterium]|nr:beta-lactamase family protein [Candidatus Competibacteraceae bacterium]MCB1809150.1 beta-lactamase family protein [Candidatus Competibacteraceae bacterium]MCB1810109.1 beta-lactamase family protein [Candidatus Competibacteraceae bacterium]